MSEYKEMTQSEAFRMFNKILPIGEYEVSYTIEGGIYNPKLAGFPMEKIAQTTSKIKIIADEDKK